MGSGAENTGGLDESAKSGAPGTVCLYPKECRYPFAEKQPCLGDIPPSRVFYILVIGS